MLKLPHWDDFACSCLDDIIAASANSPMVLLRTRDMLTRLGREAPASGQLVLASRLQWVEDTLARNLPVVWADIASAAEGRPAPHSPRAPG
jgi:hypothetical protein